ncbi:protein of unknown function [uncultured Sphingopyxis sp.]|uniref:Uncharacterized protein n=1 Tax=uncultured Sphingopyxis sp. TaxID=310581 RepID=A0A1Y5PUH2_9SPHN|nr:protein of unknown function [uncultured Sphingopyxis sp.]
MIGFAGRLFSFVIPAKAGIQLLPIVRDLLRAFASLRESLKISRKGAKARRGNKAGFPPSRE